MTTLSEAFTTALAKKSPKIDEANKANAKRYWRILLERMQTEGAFSELDILITQELAAEILLLNTKNRALKESQMPSLIAAIKDGRWINTGHPIVISSDGQLQDGQHRLTAVVRTEIPVRMDIRFGIHPHAFAVTDIGSKRAPADTLQIAGYSQVTALAAASRILIGIERNATVINNFPNDLCLKYVQDHPILVDAARIGHSSAKALHASPAACTAAVYLIATTKTVDAADRFFTELRTGAGPNFLKPTAPMPRLRAALEGGLFGNSKSLVAGFILAFNAHSRGRTLRNKDALLVPAGEPFPSVM